MDNMFQDFLSLLNTKREFNDDMDKPIEEFCLKYPNNASISFCSNETFSSSLILIFKESDKINKMVCFDQHQSDAVIINLYQNKKEDLISKLKA